MSRESCGKAYCKGFWLPLHQYLGAPKKGASIWICGDQSCAHHPVSLEQINDSAHKGDK
jgi:hypothetical protein